MKTERPVNLDLMTISLPIPAVVSILHRLSGILLFLAVPILLFIWQQSLKSAEDFAHLQQCFSHVWVKLCVWVILSGFIYHLLAGVRHLIADYGYGESLAAGRITAKVTLILSMILIILVGVWLW